jgi:transcriptional regulator with XRE-family HTH domain
MSGHQRISRERRRELEECARQVRLRGQLAHWPPERIVEEILREVPQLLPLEAYRLAHGWTREQLAQALDLLYRQDGRPQARISPAEICGWEHGRHAPSSVRQDYLARVYRTRPDRLGFGRDHSRAGSAAGNRAAGASVPGAPAAPVGPAAPVAPAVPVAPAAPVVADPGVRIVRAGSAVGDVIVAHAGGGMDRRTVIKLLGGLAVTGIPPQLDLDQLNVARQASQYVDSALVASLRAVTTAYGNQRETMSPALLVQPVLGQLRYLQGLFEGTANPTVRRELGFVTGETAILAGWLFMSLTSLDQARRHFGYARDIASELEDRTLGAYSRIFESAVHSRITHAQSPEETRLALGLLEEAAAAGPALSPPMRARLAAQQAEEHAILRQAEACERALDRAREAAAQIAQDECVGLFSDWREARLPIYEGTCRLLLGEARRAASTLEEAYARIGGAKTGVSMITRIDLGSAYVQAGEVDEGARLIGEGFEGARQMGRQGIMRRARRARQRLEQWKDEPAVRALDERLTAG